MYRDGCSLRSVADEIGVGRKSIWRYLAALGEIRDTDEANVVAWDYGRFNAPAPDLSLSSDFAWLIGVLLGDGSVFAAASKEYVIALSVTDSEFATAFEDVLEAVGLNPSHYLNVQEYKKDLYQVRAHSKRFYNWWKTLDHSDIEEIAYSYPAAFVRGMYDSEGSLTQRSGWRLSVSNTEKWLLDLIVSVTVEDAAIEFRGPYTSSSIHAIYLYRDGDVRHFCDWVEPTIPRKDCR